MIVKGGIPYDQLLARAEVMMPHLEAGDQADLVGFAFDRARCSQSPAIRVWSRTMCGLSPGARCRTKRLKLPCGHACDTHAYRGTIRAHPDPRPNAPTGRTSGSR